MEYLIGQEIRSFAYPVGSHNAAVLELTRKHYDFAVTMNHGLQAINDTTNWHRINRIYIPRGTSLNRFIDFVRGNR